MQVWEERKHLLHLYEGKDCSLFHRSITIILFIR